jgi:peptidoglycan L-alanyl-D-glutamate endopeptidase CwlK
MSSGFVFSAASRKNMANVNRILVELALRAIDKSTVDFGVIRNGGFRTVEQQRELYKLGRSKADGIVKISYHQTGNALDLIPWVDGKFTWSSKEAFNAINKAVMEAWGEMNVKGVKLEWGGNWKFYDPAHYQIKAI